MCLAASVEAELVVPVEWLLVAAPLEVVGWCTTVVLWQGAPLEVAEGWMLCSLWAVWVVVWVLAEVWVVAQWWL